MKTNQIAVSGVNGNQGTISVGLSSSLSLSMFDDTFSELAIKNITQPIKLQIATSSKAQTGFLEYNSESLMQIVNNLTSNFTLNSTYNFWSNKISLNPNATRAVFIHIRPENNTKNSTIGYVFWVKYGKSVSISDYDERKVFCPEDLTTQMNETFYYYFSNSSRNQSFVSFGIRELIKDEFDV